MYELKPHQSTPYVYPKPQFWSVILAAALSLVCCFVLTPSTAEAAAKIFYDDFSDGSMSDWTRGDSNSSNGSDYWGIVNGGYYAPQAWCAAQSDGGATAWENYDDNMSAYMRKTVSLTGFKNCELKFDYYLATEEGYDYLAVKINGQEKWRASGFHNWDGSSQKTIDLSAYDGQSITIEFFFYSDSSINSTSYDGDGAWVDNIGVYGDSITYLTNFATSSGSRLQSNFDVGDTIYFTLNNRVPNDSRIRYYQVMMYYMLQDKTWCNSWGNQVRYAPYPVTSAQIVSPGSTYNINGNIDVGTDAAEAVVDGQCQSNVTSNGDFIAKVIYLDSGKNHLTDIDSVWNSAHNWSAHPIVTCTPSNDNINAFNVSGDESGVSFDLAISNNDCSDHNYSYDMYVDDVQVCSRVVIYESLATKQSRTLTNQSCSTPLGGGDHELKVVLFGGNYQDQDTEDFHVEGEIGSPPSMSSIPNQTVTENTLFSLATSSYATATDGDAIEAYELTGSLPSGLSFNASSGLLSGTPAAGSAGTYSLSARARDKDGWSNAVLFSLVVSQQSITYYELGALAIRADAISGAVNGVRTATGNVSINDFIQFDGNLTINENALTISGDGRLYISGIPVWGDYTLWDDSFTFDANGYLESLDLTVGFKGFSISLSSVHIATDKVTITGGFSVTNGAAVSVSDLSISAQAVELKSASFTLAGLSVDISSSTPDDGSDDLVLAGALQLPEQMGGLSVNTEFILHQGGGIDLRGRVDLPDVKVGHSGYQLKDGWIEFDTVENRFYGGAELQVPHLFNVTAEVGVLEGKLNRVYADFDNINPPITFAPPVPVSLNRIAAGLDNMVYGPLILQGGVGFLAGPQILIGSDYFYMVSATVDIVIDTGGRFTGEGVLYIISDDGRLGSAKVVIDKNDGVSIRGELTIPPIAGQEVVQVVGNMRVDLQNHFSGSLEGAVCAPDDWWLIGGDCYGGILVTVENTFISAKIPLPVVGDVTIKYSRETGFELFSLSSMGLPTSALQSDGKGAWTIGGNLNLADSFTRISGLDSPSSTQVLTLGAAQPWAIFRVTWAIDVDMDFSLQAPDGTTYEPTTSAEGVGYRKNLSINEAYYAIANPQVGQWSLLIPDAPDPGEVVAQLIIPNAPPTLAVTAPSSKVAGSPVTITWNASDEDNQALVSLYYDDDREGFDGSLIAEGLSEGIGQSYSWDTAAGNLHTGTYFVYAKVTDGNNSPVYAYAPGLIAVQQAGAPDPPANAMIVSEGDYIHCQWDAYDGADFRGYRIYYRGVDSAAAVAERLDVGSVTFHDLNELSSGEYSVYLTAYDDQGRESAGTEPVVVLVEGDGENDPPVITSTPPTSAVSGDPYQYAATATDQETPDAIVWSKVNGPAAMAVNSQTGLVTWEPGDADLGPHLVAISATDAGLAEATQSFYINVKEPWKNSSPIFTSLPPGARVSPGSSFTYTMNASDADGDTLTFSIIDGPTGMGLSGTTLSWTPQAGQEGRYLIMVGVTDNNGGSATQKFELVVSSVVDSDLDGVADQDDNCPSVINGQQADLDSDGLGNACDLDMDGDGFSNTFEEQHGSDPLDASSVPDIIISISGRILDDQGQPIVGRTAVNIFSGLDCSNPNSMYQGWAEADEQGNFSVEGIKLGSYYIRAHPVENGMNYVKEWWTGVGSSPECSQAQQVVVDENNPEVSGLVFNLSPGATISGSVTDANGDPVQWAQVRAYEVVGDESGNVDYVDAPWAMTDQDGHYSLVGLSPGSVVVEAQTFVNNMQLRIWYDGQTGALTPTDALVVDIDEEASIAGVDLTTLSGQGSISISLADAQGQPIYDTTVKLSAEPCSDYHFATAYGFGTAQIDINDLPLNTTIYLETNFNDAVLNSQQPYLNSYYRDGVPAGHCRNAEAIILTEQAPSLGPTTMTVYEGGYLTGLVTDDDGNPLVGAWVETTSCWAANTPHPYASYTDAEGVYSLKTVVGENRVRVVGRNSQTDFIDQYWSTSGPVPDVGSAECLQLQMGETLVRDFEGVPTQGIVGRVLNWEGVPQANKSIVVYGQDACIGDQIITVVSDAQGYYAIDLEPGLYTLLVGLYPCVYWAGNDGGFSPHCKGALPVEVVQDQVSTANFSLPRPSYIIGKVIDAEGLPLEGVEILATDADCSFPSVAPCYGYTTTDAEGNYSFSSLAPGNYFLDIISSPYGIGFVSEYLDGDPAQPGLLVDCQYAGTINLSGGEGRSVPIQLGRYLSISGRVTDSQGAPAAGVGVTAYAGMCEGGTSYEAITDEQGNYTMEVPIGPYYVLAGSHGSRPNLSRLWYDGAAGTTECSQATQVSVNIGASPESIDFSLPASGHILGRVTSDAGDGLENVCVYAYTTTDTGFMYLARVYTDANGDFVLTGMASGDYVLQTSNDEDWADEWWTSFGGSASWRDAESLSVVVDEGTRFDFTLSPGATLEGYVRDGQGAPIANCPISAMMGADACQASIDWHTAYTDAQGFYRITGLSSSPSATGDLRLIRARPGDSGLPYASEWYDGGDGIFACDGAQGLSLAAGSTQQIDFTLEAGSSIAGTVTNSRGQPLPYRNVLVYVDCNRPNVASGWVDSNGHYQIGGLVAGDYYLWAYDDQNGYFADEWYTSDGGTDQCETAEAQSVATGQNLTDRNFVLEEAGYITGQVLDEQGNPVEGLQVLASSNQCQYNGVTATTDAGGTFWLTVPPGSLYLYAQGNSGGHYYGSEWYDGSAGTTQCDQAVGVGVDPGETVGGKDFTLSTGGVIKGRVTDVAGNPLEGVIVRSYWYTCWQDQVGQATTDADGNYAFAGLAPGDHFVVACPRCAGEPYLQDQWWNSEGGTIDCAGAENINLYPNETQEGIDFLLEAAGAISGRVIDGSGSPIEGVNMQVVGTSIGEHTDSNGDYQIKGVPPGDQTVMACATCQGLNYVNEYYDDQTSQDAAAAVSVNVGATTPDIDFALTAGALISGTITAPDNSPLEHMGVNLRTDACDSNSRVMGDWTDSEGVYTMIGVPAGSYYIGAWPNYSGFPYRDEFWSSAGDAFACGQAEAVTVSAGQQATGYDIAVNGAPEIDVLDGSTSLPSDSGDKLDFGSVAVGSSTTKTLTIENTGNADLVLDGSPVVMVAGPCDGDYTVTAQPASSVAGGGSTTFTVRFAPTSHGERRAFLVIQNNDPNEDPYVIHLKGWATTPAAQASYAAPSFEDVGLFSIQYQGPNGRLVKLGVRATVNGPGPLDARLTLTKPNSETVNFETVRYRRGPGVEFFWSDSSWTGPPADGQYTLTVTDSAGRTASTTVDFTYAEVPLPVITSPDNETHTGSTTPTFTMDPAGEGYYPSFQVRSYDRTNNGTNDEGDVILYTSPPDSASSVTVPAGTLQDNSAYKLLGMTRDTASGNAFNLGLTTRYFYTGGTAADLPVADEVLFTTRWENYYDMMRFVWRNPGVAPWEIDYVAITDPDSGVRYPGGFMQTLFEAPSRLVGTLTLSGDAADGDYVVDMQANGHSASRTMAFTLDGVDAVGSSGRSPGHNAYVRPSQGTLSWGPVAGDVQYSVAVYPMDRDTVIWESGLTSETSVDLPDTILQDGDSYEWSVRTWRNATPLNNMGYSKRFVLNMRSTLPSQGASNILAVLLASADSDGDGIPDSVEKKTCTSATNPDSDGDGISDGVEDANQNGVRDDGESNPCSADSDGDGIDDGQEDVNHNGVVDEGETDPNKEDTDGDGMPDKYEVDNGLDPLVNDANLDKDGDGYTNKQECDSGTLANDADSKPISKIMAPMLPLLLHR